MSKPTIKSILAPYVVTLEAFTPLCDTPFRLNALNGIYGLAKVGKTTFVLETLNSLLKPHGYQIHWLDGDRNGELMGKYPNISHLSLGRRAEAIQSLIDTTIDLTNHILIIDSFKNFTFGYSTDDNAGCQSIFDMYQRLLDKGATIIVIFHATKLRENGTLVAIKVKGNEDVIESNMDFLFKFERTDTYSKLIVQCSRDRMVQAGNEFTYTDKSWLKSEIRSIVTKEPNISLRDLKKTSGMSGLESEIDSLKGIVFFIESVKATGGGRPKDIVRLIEPKKEVLVSP